MIRWYSFLYTKAADIANLRLLLGDTNKILFNYIKYELNTIDSQYNDHKISRYVVLNGFYMELIQFN